MDEAYLICSGEICGKTRAWDLVLPRPEYRPKYDSLQCLNPACRGKVSLREQPIRNNTKCIAFFQHSNQYSNQNCLYRASWNSPKLDFGFSTDPSQKQLITLLEKKLIKIERLFHAKHFYDIQNSPEDVDSECKYIDVPVSEPNLNRLSLIYKIIACTNRIQPLIEDKTRYFQKELVERQQKFLRFQDISIFPEWKTRGKYGTAVPSMKLMVQKHNRIFADVLLAFLFTEESIRNNILREIFYGQNSDTPYFSSFSNSLLNQDDLTIFLTIITREKIFLRTK